MTAKGHDSTHRSCDVVVRSSGRIQFDSVRAIQPHDRSPFPITAISTISTASPERGNDRSQYQLPFLV